ncbi:unnamed protein product [Protopolystoma xenopodis]|uniref:G-protein coupled receptors family 1 profile domain-containing protein n=1 Tax=Protopolystoma xenopodis TaxID=117903 RepID=A0A3S5BSN4_9PLAT|nr:unnamed protein product [Protopolystoma xenopodis]
MRDVSYLSDQAYWHYTIAQSLIYLTMFLLLTVIYATIFLFVRRRQMLMNVKYTYPTGFATRVSERVGLLHSTAGDEEDEADELILPDMPVGKADNPLDDGVNGTTSEGVSESVKQVGEEATDTDWPGKRLTGLPVHKVTVDEPTADLGLGLRQMNELRANSQEASPEISTGSQTAIGAIRQPDNRRQSQTVRPAEGTSSIVTMVTITGPHESTGAKKLQTEETIRLKMFSSPARPVEPIAKSSTDQLAVQTTTSRPKRSLDRVNQQPISTSEASSPVYPAGYTGSVYPAFCYCYCDPRGCCPAEGHDTGGWQLRWRWRWFWIRSDPGDLASEAEAETESWSRQRIGLTATESAISSLQTSQAASANTCTTDGDRVAVSQADARAGLEAVTKAQMMGNAGTSDTLDQQDDEFLLRPDADGPLVWNALLQPGKPGDISTSGTGEEGICARGLIAAARLQERRRRPYIRTAQTLVAITICFILSYLPFLVQGLLRPHVRPPMPYGTSIYGESSHFSLYLYFLNSVVNPIIYSCMNQHFQARICGLGRSLAAALSPSRKRGRGNHANEHGGARKCRRHLRGRRKCPDRSIAATTCCMSTPAADETVGPTVSSQNWSYCSSKQLYNADKNEHIISSYLADQNQYQTLVSIATDRLTEDAKCGTTGESEPPEWPGLCNKNEEEASTLTFSEARIKVCVPERGRSVR